MEKHNQNNNQETHKGSSSFLASLESEIHQSLHHHHQQQQPQQSMQYQPTGNPFTPTQSTQYDFTQNHPFFNQDYNEDDDIDWEVVDEDETEDEDSSSSSSSSGDEYDEPNQRKSEGNGEIDLSYYEDDGDINELEGDDLVKLLEDLKQDLDPSFLTLLEPAGENATQSQHNHQHTQQPQAQQNHQSHQLPSSSGYIPNPQNQEAHLEIQPQQEHIQRQQQAQQHQSTHSSSHLPEQQLQDAHTQSFQIPPPQQEFIETGLPASAQETLAAIAKYQSLYAASAKIHDESVKSIEYRKHQENPIRTRTTSTPQPIENLTQAIEHHLSTPVSQTIDTTNHRVSKPNSRVTTTLTPLPYPMQEESERTRKKSLRYANRVPHNAGTTSNDVGIEEKCNLCLRIFRGPKARTHKQQHIKKLHPDSYIRGKSGRKSSVVHTYIQGPSVKN